MDYMIDAQAMREGDEVLTLWRAYRDAGFGIQMMGVHATVGFEQADLARYANTDKMPFRIAGKLYVVSEVAASVVATSTRHMTQWEKDAHVNARDLCIECLTHILDLLRDRRPVTIVCSSPMRWTMRISAPDSPDQTADAVAMMVALAAIRLNTFSIQQLLAETVRLIPA